MRITTLLVHIFIFITVAGFDAQAGRVVVPPHGQSIYSTTGTVKEIRTNRVIIEEDGTRNRLKFHYLKRDIDRFKIGDRVRVYFRDIRKPVVSIKILSELDYDPDRQNLGYISGNPPNKGE